ncbi:MAG: hypothetical protein OCC49_00170 [Fibrobacterales bacterium]
MKAIKSLFFWICVGIIALAVGFYFTAPMMGLDDSLYNILISAAIAVLGLSISFLIKMKKHYNSIQKKKPKSNAAEWETSWQKPLADETKEILKRIQEVYKKTNVSIEKTKFFLVIGQKGSGKSTLIRESGHHMRYIFPTARDKQQRRQIFFNWSVSDNAVYIEAPSDYLANGDKVAQELLFLLELLRDEPKKKTLDGIIVTEKVHDLADNDNAKARAQVNRKTVEGVMAQIQLELPVYVALTNLDTLPGAKLYCDAHEESFLNQSFGVSIKHSEAKDTRSVFDKRYGELLDGLYDNQMFSMYSQQKKGIAPVETYAFVRGLEERRANIGDYVEILCKKGLTKEISYFRGLYFTGVESVAKDQPSAAPVAPALDPFGGAAFFEDEGSTVSAAPEVNAIEEPEPVLGGLSYFAHAFLAWVEGEKELARYPKYRQSSMSRSAALISFLLFLGAAGVAGYGVYGFTMSKVLLNRWEELVNDARRLKWSQPKTIIREFSKYDGLRLAIEDIEENRSLKIAPGFYPDGKILPKAEKKHIVLSHALTRNCLKTLEKELNNRLTAGVRDSERTEVYNDFKLYASLTTAGKGNYDKMNVDSVGAGLARKWYKLLGITPYTASQHIKETLPLNARLYAQYLIDERVHKGSKLYVANPALVKKARRALAGESEVEAIYQAMLEAGNSAPALRLSDLGIEENSIIINAGEVPAAYTKAVYDSVIKPFFTKTNSAQGDWVLGKDKEKSTVSKELEEKVMNKYYRDYAYTWRSFIKNITTKRTPDLQRLSEKLISLASASQDETLLGLRAFIEHVSINTNLVMDLSGAKNLANKVSGPNKKLNNKMKVVRRYQDDIPESMLSPQERLSKKFSGFSVLTEQVRGKKFDDYFEDLVKTSKFLIETTGNPNEAITFLGELFKGDRKNPANHAYSAAQAYIDEVPARQQDLLKNTLLLIVREVVNSVVSYASIGLQEEYEKQVVTNYESYLQASFPFDHEEREKMASLEDLTFIFGGKSGTFTNFYKKIYDFIDMKSDYCGLKEWKGISMPFSSKALKGIHKAFKIQEALFHPNVDRLRQYQLKHKFMAVKRANLVMRYGNEEYSVMRGEDQKVFTMKWPDQKLEGISVEVETVDDTYTKNYKGVWGLISMVRDIGEKRNQNTVEINWPIKAKSYYISVDGEIQVDRRFNPLIVRDFFILPIEYTLVEEPNLEEKE